MPERIFSLIRQGQGRTNFRNNGPGGQRTQGTTGQRDNGITDTSAFVDAKTKAICSELISSEAAKLAPSVFKVTHTFIARKEQTLIRKNNSFKVSLYETEKEKEKKRGGPNT